MSQPIHQNVLPVCLCINLVSVLIHCVSRVALLSIVHYGIEVDFSKWRTLGVLPSGSLQL